MKTMNQATVGTLTLVIGSLKLTDILAMACTLSALEHPIEQETQSVQVGDVLTFRSLLATSDENGPATVRVGEV